MIKNIKFVHEIASADKDAEFSSFRMREIYKQLRDTKKIPRNQEANKLVGPTIKQLRKELTFNVSSVMILSFSGKNYQYQVVMPQGLDLKKRNEFLKKEWVNYKESLKKERAKLRLVKSETKKTLGFEYTTTGGVFINSGAVLALQSQASQLIRIKKPKAPSATSKSNYIGIELELVAKVNREQLNNIFCKHYLAGYIYVKDDSSINREQNNDIAHEVTILCKEEQVSDVVTRICNVLNSSEVGAYVNNSCGLHVHIDSRNRDHKLVYNRLFNGLPMILNMVPKNRVDSAHASRYCKVNQYSSYDEANENQDKYYAINTKCYSNYKTIEVRIHSGSTNAKKIINFIEILTTLVNNPTKGVVHNAEEFSMLYNISSKLKGYIEYRTKLFSSKLAAGIDTRMDHFFFDDMQQISL